MAAPASTRWRSAVITSTGGRISTCSTSSTSSVLRYGPPLHKTFIGPGRYDWSFADMTFAEIERRNIVPIVDLCHFGVPDWIGNFQNPDFPDLFASYAEDFARRFPWVQLYTPVNEMFICAQFSAAYGWWNEQMTTRPELRDGAQAHREGQRARHGARSSRSVRMRSSSRASRRSTSTPRTRPRSSRPRS